MPVHRLSKRLAFPSPDEAEEGGLLWNDPDLGIAWPISAEEATLSARDLEWPRFKDFVSPF